MSWNVECSGKIIWEPALIVGRMFLDELTVLEQVFRCRSGIVDNFDDTMEVDQSQLDLFIQRGFVTLDRTNSGPMLALSEGCFAVAIALQAQITGRWPTAPAHVQRIVERAKTVLFPVHRDTMPDDAGPWSVEVPRTDQPGTLG